MSSATPRESRQFLSFIKQDLQLLNHLSGRIRKHDGLSSFYSSVVSKYPWNDICLLVWVACFMSIVELGKKHMWVLIVNLVASYGTPEYLSLSFLMPMLACVCILRNFSFSLLFN